MNTFKKVLIFTFLASLYCTGAQAMARLRKAYSRFTPEMLSTISRRVRQKSTDKVGQVFRFQKTPKIQLTRQQEFSKWAKRGLVLNIAFTTSSIIYNEEQKKKYFTDEQAYTIEELVNLYPAFTTYLEKVVDEKQINKKHLKVIVADSKKMQSLFGKKSSTIKLNCNAAAVENLNGEQCLIIPKVLVDEVENYLRNKYPILSIKQIQSTSLKEIESALAQEISFRRLPKDLLNEEQEIYENTLKSFSHTIGHELTHLCHRDGTTQYIANYLSVPVLLIGATIINKCPILMGASTVQRAVDLSLVALIFSSQMANGYSRYCERRADISSSTNEKVIQAGASLYEKLSEFFKEDSFPLLKRALNTVSTFPGHATHPLCKDRARYLQELAKSLEQNAQSKN
jgi:hypothetical protein